MLNRLKNKIKHIFRYNIIHSEIIYSIYKVLLIDTTKVFHHGSSKSSKPRTIFMAQYVTKYSTSKNKDITINNNFDNRKSGKVRLFIEKNSSLNNKNQYLKFII